MKFRIVSLLFLAKQTRVVNSGAFAELELQRGAAGATPVPCVASSQPLQSNALGKKSTQMLSFCSLG